MHSQERNDCVIPVQREQNKISQPQYSYTTNRNTDKLSIQKKFRTSSPLDENRTWNFTGVAFGVSVGRAVVGATVGTCVGGREGNAVGRFVLGGWVG